MSEPGDIPYIREAFNKALGSGNWAEWELMIVGQVLMERNVDWTDVSKWEVSRRANGEIHVKVLLKPEISSVDIEIEYKRSDLEDLNDSA